MYDFRKENRHFLSRSSNCSELGIPVQRKKTKQQHSVLKKALEISSVFECIGMLGLWRNTNVEFELYPPSESKAELIGQMHLNVTNVIISRNLIFVNNNHRTRLEVTE